MMKLELINRPLLEQTVLFRFKTLFSVVAAVVAAAVALCLFQRS